MLRPHEIIARMPDETASQLFTFMYERDKRLYKATIEALCKQRKLRPVFVERKPRPERHAWMREMLGKKANEGTSAHLLQIWLVSQHKGLLCDFLDAFGIAHDDNGTIENLPPSPTRDELSKAVTALLDKHDRGVVAVYLHTFQALDDNGWPALDELLGEDPRLQLSVAGDVPAPLATAE